jgi:nicotinamide-nucleotide adenylyltransferase
MLNECEQVIIAVGSAQESGTERNPFNFYQRADLITNVFYQHIIAGRMSIIPLKDREKPSNDASWGDYVFEKVKWFTNEKPDVVYEGEETERNTWYDNLDVTIVKVPRGDIPVSATEIREGLCGNGVHSLSVNPMIPAAIRYRIKEMKEVIRNAKQN